MLYAHDRPHVLEGLTRETFGYAFCAACGTCLFEHEEHGEYTPAAVKKVRCGECDEKRHSAAVVVLHARLLNKAFGIEGEDIWRTPESLDDAEEFRFRGYLRDAAREYWSGQVTNRVAAIEYDDSRDSEGETRSAPDAAIEMTERYGEVAVSTGIEWTPPVDALEDVLSASEFCDDWAALRDRLTALGSESSTSEATR